MEFDRRFVWDYDISEDLLKDEAVQRWYLARVLTRGTLADLHAVGFETIRQALPSRVLPAPVRRFWERYFTVPDQAA